MYSHTLSFRDTETSRTSAQRTFLIFGVNRGGTTATAGAIRRLGMFLGDDLGGNLEDRLFRKRLGMDTIRETVAARDADHDVWGWKHPHPHQYIDELLPDLRNLRLILVTRDLAANSLGTSSWDREDIDKAISMYLAQTRKNVDLMRRVDCPALVVSYEKLLVKPEAVVGDMAHFCGLKPSASELAHAVDFIKPGAYQPGEAQDLSVAEKLRHRGSRIKRALLRR
ncbi:sulfotransferase [uncultured Shimia sp.]|uniref:sulfotransferase n=1 Tax=uncultured Shimia sp. TaxID=573152 RepID=UPI00262B368C|nr:sulfotransferase [uncultured Shimia sp.]